MTTPTPLTVGALLDAIAEVPDETWVATEDGDLLSMPMPGSPVIPGAPVELTVLPLPPEPGQFQTVADVKGLLSEWATVSADPATPGPDSLIVLAPLGEPASVIVAVAHTVNGLALSTQPL